MTTPVIPPTPLSALDAVNQMLQSIGQGRVNSLATSASVDAMNAINTLTNTTREVQARGWWFNREYDYTLTADAEGHLSLPETVLGFAPDRTYAQFLVERGGRLYDRVNHTYEFEPGYQVSGSIIWHLPFDDLPHTARQYIGRRAGREFQIGAVGAELLYKFTREMEQEAQTELLREHLRAEQPNAIYDNASVYRISGAGRYGNRR